MKKSVSLFAIAVISLTVNQSLSAQEKTVARNLFFNEFGGPGIIMSANMDSRFKPNTRLGLGYRLGAGFGIGRFSDKSVMDMNGNIIGYEKVTRTIYAFPVGLNYILGKPDRSSAFEVGGGVSILSRKISLYTLEVEEEGQVIGYATFMYRITPINGGMSFRIGFTPIIGTAGDLFPMGAISFGYAF
jgi:hypothetical protein